MTKAKIRFSNADINMKTFEKFMDEYFDVTEEAVAKRFNTSIDTVSRRVKEHYNMTFAEFKKINKALKLLELKQLTYLSLKKNLENNNVAVTVKCAESLLGMKDLNELEIKSDNITIEIK